MYNSSPNQIKYAALRREISEGFAQIKRGEYTEYDEHTIKDLAADIKDRGMKEAGGETQDADIRRLVWVRGAAFQAAITAFERACLLSPKKTRRSDSMKKEWLMETVNIFLPKALKQFVDDQVSAGVYSSVSDYFRALVEEV